MRPKRSLVQPNSSICWIGQHYGEAVRACRPNAAIHLAGKAFVPDSFSNPRATFDANFTGTLNLLEALAESGFQGRFLYIGSGDVYGLVEEHTLPIRETQPLRPRNPYAVSKVAAEALCYQWSQTGPFEVVMARPFNHIGPGQSERFAISDFAKQIAEIKLGRRPPKLAAGDIDVTRDFTDVRDVVRAYLLLLDKGRGGEAYNVCSGIEHRLRDLIDQLVDVAGVRIQITADPKRLRRAEQQRICGSHAKLHEATGWQPKIGIHQSVYDILGNWIERLT